MNDRAGYAAQPVLTRDSASNPRSAQRDLVANLLAGAWLDRVMVVLALLACFATCLLTLRAVGGMEGLLSWSIAGILALIFLAPALARGGALAAAFALRLADIAGRIPVWQIVLAGAVLRGSWVSAFPAESGADGAVYMGLASRLGADHTNEVAGTRAYWPVGYPLFLSFWVGMLGEGRVALLAANSFQHIVAAVGISRPRGHSGRASRCRPCGATLCVLAEPGRQHRNGRKGNADRHPSAVGLSRGRDAAQRRRQVDRLERRADFGPVHPRAAFAAVPSATRGRLPFSAASRAPVHPL